MNKSQYNPEIHHRRSIRLKGHDYAGGGLYFVTLCAHREFVASAKGVPFGELRATQVSPIRDLLEEQIAQYIRMNPWRCVQNFEKGLRGMGNPALWNLPKLGICCSRNAPRPKAIPRAATYLSGFHSPMEKEIFQKLLDCKRPLIWCPAWGLERAVFAPGVREALEENRMLILEMRHLDGDLAAAEQRNRFVLEQAEVLWLPHVSSDGMIDRLVREMQVQEKIS